MKLYQLMISTPSDAELIQAFSQTEFELALLEWLKTVWHEVEEWNEIGEIDQYSVMEAKDIFFDPDNQYQYFIELDQETELPVFYVLTGDGRYRGCFATLALAKAEGLKRETFGMDQDEIEACAFEWEDDEEEGFSSMQGIDWMWTITEETIQS